MKGAFRPQRRKMHERMDAAGAVDAQNASTAPWKTAQNAVSHSAHTHHRLLGEGRRGLHPETASHTKFLTLPVYPTDLDPWSSVLNTSCHIHRFLSICPARWPGVHRRK